MTVFKSVEEGPKSLLRLLIAVMCVRSILQSIDGSGFIKSFLMESPKRVFAARI